MVHCESLLSNGAFFTSASPTLGVRCQGVQRCLRKRKREREGERMGEVLRHQAKQASEFLMVD